MNDTAENRLKRTVFIVEANSFECLCLWQQHAKESHHQSIYPKQNWEQIHSGWMITVAKIDERPVCIDTRWYKIDGCLVMFYDACSQLVDYIQIEKWLKKNFINKYDNDTRWAQCDAMNFGHCLSAIREHNEKNKFN
jgi:hypothetical protein